MSGNLTAVRGLTETKTQKLGIVNGKPVSCDCFLVQGMSRNFKVLGEKLSLSHTHLFNGSLSRTTRVSQYQKGKTNLDFTGARDSEWQWHQLGMCKSAPRSRQVTTPAPHHS